MFNPPAIRKVFEGVASRHEMYALFNRHGQSPFDEDRHRAAATSANGSKSPRPTMTTCSRSYRRCSSVATCSP
jgi:hypothetical protein